MNFEQCLSIFLVPRAPLQSLGTPANPLPKISSTFGPLGRNARYGFKARVGTDEKRI